MAIFSGGPISNSGVNPSTSVQIMISNDDIDVTATVELEVFEVVISSTGAAKVGAVHQLFTLAPLTVATRIVNITGFPAYEVQASVIGTTNVLVDAFGKDAVGNLNAAQRVLQSERTAITALTPLP